ncbi:MAG: hypothetical protein ACRDGA_06135 [Bacteroidota bacterium]
MSVYDFETMKAIAEIIGIADYISKSAISEGLKAILQETRGRKQGSNGPPSKYPTSSNPSNPNKTVN